MVVAIERSREVVGMMVHQSYEYTIDEKCALVTMLDKVNQIQILNNYK